MLENKLSNGDTKPLLHSGKPCRCGLTLATSATWLLNKMVCVHGIDHYIVVAKSSSR
jgi:hypothetical protein